MNLSQSCGRWRYFCDNPRYDPAQTTYMIAWLFGSIWTVEVRPLRNSLPRNSGRHEYTKEIICRSQLNNPILRTRDSISESLWSTTFGELVAKKTCSAASEWCYRVVIHWRIRIQQVTILSYYVCNLLILPWKCRSYWTRWLAYTLCASDAQWAPKTPARPWKYVNFSNTFRHPYDPSRQNFRINVLMQ